MSKKKLKFDIKSIISKGKELYDEYGDTVLSITRSLSTRDKLQTASSKDVLIEDNMDDVSEGQISGADDNDIQTIVKPKALKTYRQEIEEEDSFHESMAILEDSVSFVYKGQMTPDDVQNALNALATVATDTIRYAEEQETKREEIRAMRDTAIAQVNAMRDVVQTYLEKSFDERASLFAEQFKCVDAALRSGDNEMLSISLNSINTLAASSPFKNLADLNNVTKALTDSNTEWDI
jgi:hypothetical protein